MTEIKKFYVYNKPDLDGLDKLTLGKYYNLTEENASSAAMYFPSKGNPDV